MQNNQLNLDLKLKFRSKLLYLSNITELVYNCLSPGWEAFWTVSNEQTRGRGFGSLQTRLLLSCKVKSRDEGRDEILDCKQFIVMKKFSFSAEVHFLRQLQTRLHFFIPCKKERNWENSCCIAFQMMVDDAKERFNRNPEFFSTKSDIFSSLQQLIWHQRNLLGHRSTIFFGLLM